MKTLREIPAVVALAEKQARLRIKTFAQIEGAHCAPDGEVRIVAGIELEILCDLSNPASRDAIARLIAEAIGWDAFDVTRAVESSAEMLAGLYRVAGLPELPRWEPVPPPAEALRLIAIAVLGGSRG